MTSSSDNTPVTNTRQSEFWRGEFGTAYTDRNIPEDALLRARVQMWSSIFACMKGAPPASILEVGANLGVNLRALRAITGAEFSAIEPNGHARHRLVSDGVVPAERVHDSLASAIPLGDGSVDMAFTSGVLIHIAPADLLESCREICRVARRHVVCIEYFSDKPEEISYRDQTGFLFKRDFGSFYLDNFPNLRVVDYGFSWKRLTGLDNLTWWVFEKV